MLTGILVAQKMYNDQFYNNNTLSRLGGVPLQELNAMERCFLESIGFDLYISEENYQEINDKMNKFFGNPFRRKTQKILADTMNNTQALST